MKLQVGTGGQWFVKLLQKKNAQFVFGTTGAGMPDIQDAMVVEKPPKWIQGLHEFVTVNAASGYALASGRPGIALIDRIVGTQNSIGAFYGAYLNSSPAIIFASSNVPGVPMETGAVELHSSSFQNIMVAPWVKWSTELHSLETMPQDIDKAFHMALSEHRAPVYMTLRQDLMAKTIRSGWTSDTENALPSSRVPDDRTLQKTCKEILAHDDPQVIVSHLGRHPEAVESLVKLCHLFGIAVRERRFFMNYSVADRFHLGFLSRYGPPEISKSTDLILAVDVGFLPHQTFGENVDVIDLASDPLHRQDVYAGGDYGASLFPAIVRATCDTGPTLEKLVKLGRRLIKNSDKGTIEERKSKVSAQNEKLVGGWREKALQSYEKGSLDDWAIGYVLNKQWSREMTWVNGAATSWEVLLKTVEVESPGTYFGNPSGHLGVTVGMAYGVALANKSYGRVKDHGSYKAGEITGPNHVVVCTVGDGDAIFGNIDSALWTCSHYGIGVLYVILNNSCWGAEWTPIERSSQHWAAKAGDYEFLDLDRPSIDYRQIAKGFDVHAESVATPGEFQSALTRAIKLVKRGRPALLDLRMEKFTGSNKSVVR